MALGATIISPYGVPATYHIVANVQVDRLHRRVVFHLVGYADKEARDSGFQPLVMTPEPIPYTMSDAEPGTNELPTMSELYAHVLTIASTATENHPLYAFRDATNI